MNLRNVDRINVTEVLNVTGNCFLFTQGCSADKNMEVVRLGKEKARNIKFLLPIT